MSITIHINTEAGETLNGVLGSLGLAAVSLVQPHREAPIEVQTFGPLADNGGQQQPTPASAEGPKRTRRTKAEMEAARAAEAGTGAAETNAPQAPVFTVRRFDGQTSGEFADSGAATEHLVEMIHNAGEQGALNALMAANKDLASVLPQERIAEIKEAIKAAEAGFAAPAQPQPQAGAAATTTATTATASAGFMDIEGNPLASVTADKRGAQNVIRAIATGAAPKLGFAAAKAILDKHGIERVSALPDADPKHALIAADGAALLGLPMAGGSDLT